MPTKTLSGVVDRKEEKVGAKGNYWTVRMCGETFNVFKQSEAAFTEGKGVEVVLEKKGEYWNVLEAHPLEASNVAAQDIKAQTILAPEAPSGPAPILALPSREEAIMRGGCLHDAARIAAARAGQGKEVTAEKVLEMEDKLYRGLLKQIYEKGHDLG